MGIDNKKVSAVIVAAGRSTRMGANKMLLMLGSMTVFERTLRAFEECDEVDEVIVVASEENIKSYRAIIRENLISKVTAMVIGGDSRGESVLNGMEACRKEAEIILIHDGARPLIKPETIKEVIRCVDKYTVAAVAKISTDTLKRIDDNGFAVETVDREHTVRIQTPQGFKRNVIFEAHEKALKDGFDGTDDCSLTERLGFKSKMVFVDYVNIKLTEPSDITLATAVLRERGTL